MDRLVKRDETDDDILDFILKRPDRDQKKDRKYKEMFTPALERAWAEAEAAEVKKNCGGRYLDGEICGIDFRPLVCAQDYSEKGYLYRMDCLGEEATAITMRWPLTERPVATYRLLKRGNGWVLDSVACLPDGPGFNMLGSSTAPR